MIAPTRVVLRQTAGVTPALPRVLVVPEVRGTVAHRPLRREGRYIMYSSTPPPGERGQLYYVQ